MLGIVKSFSHHYLTPLKHILDIASFPGSLPYVSGHILDSHLLHEAMF